MEGCSFDFGNGQKEGLVNGEIQLGSRMELGSLYRSDLVRLYSIMTEKEFQKLNCKFSCKVDPKTKKPLNKNISLSEFQELQC